MKLSSQQMPSGKWGIYSDTGLLATVNSQEICETIMANLATGRRDAPFDDVDALYQAPKLRKNKTQSAGAEATSVWQETSATVVDGADGANAKTLAAAQVPAQGAVAQQQTSQPQIRQQTTEKESTAEPLKGRAKARANGSAKRKRRSSNRTKASLAS